METRFFETPAEFRAWLAANHSTATEIGVVFHKKDSGKPSMTWSDAVDQALCFGWIDSVARRLDDTSRVQRFTLRKPPPGGARRGTRGEVQGAKEGVGVLRQAAAVVQADRDLLGHECQARRNPVEAAGAPDRGLGRRPPALMSYRGGSGR